MKYKEGWDLHTETDYILTINKEPKAIVGLVPVKSLITKKIEPKYEAKLVELKDKELKTKFYLGQFEGKIEAMLMVQAAIRGDDLIQVCSECYCASCWQYKFLCDYYDIAGTIYFTKKFLRMHGVHEDESYWKTDDELANEDI